MNLAVGMGFIEIIDLRGMNIRGQSPLILKIATNLTHTTTEKINYATLSGSDIEVCYRE